MDKTLIGALIAGGTAMASVIVTQYFSNQRWKEELNRKGEDKYLEKRLEILYESSLEFLRLSQEVAKYANMENPTQSKNFKKNINALKIEILDAFNKTTPYVEVGENQMSIKSLLSFAIIEEHANNPTRNTENHELIEKHLTALTSSLYGYKRNLEELMKTGGIQKPSNKSKWLLRSSILLNVVFVAWIFFF